MRKYFLEDSLHPRGGITINVKLDNDCVFCENCKTCLADECQHELHRRYVREHNKFIKSCKGKTIKEYKRDMMRKYREESKRAKEKKASGSKLKRWCKNCEWREFDKVDGVCACVNPDSPKCAEIVNDHDGCEVWE